MKWNYQELKKNVESLYGSQQRKLLTTCLESVYDRKLYARYHFLESKRLLNEFLVNKSDKNSLFELICGIDEEEKNKFYHCTIQAEANVMACLQSLHCITDILSHVIYYSLNMNGHPNLKLLPKQISIHSVLEKLNGITEYLTLCNYINQLIANENYKYLSDIVNHSKHRSIVKAPFTVDLRGESGCVHGLEFLSFKYGKTIHDKRWADDYLEEEYNRQNPLIIEIGNEINRLVSAKMSV